MSYLVEIALSQKEPRYKVIDVPPKKVRIRWLNSNNLINLFSNKLEQTNL